MSRGQVATPPIPEIPQLGDIRQIERDFHQIVQVDPNNPGVYFVLGAIAHREGRHEAAIAKPSACGQTSPTPITTWETSFAIGAGTMKPLRAFARRCGCGRATPRPIHALHRAAAGPRRCAHEPSLDMAAKG
jgi:hypothetical protein